MCGIEFRVGLNQFESQDGALISPRVSGALEEEMAVTETDRGGAAGCCVLRERPLHMSLPTSRGIFAPQRQSCVPAAKVLLSFSFIDLFIYFSIVRAAVRLGSDVITPAGSD